MKQFVLLFLTFLALTFSPDYASAQFTIKQDTKADTRELEVKPDQRFVTPELDNLQYTTDAIRQAERRRLRHERNKLELDFGLKATQTYFSNWAKGGDNTFNGLTTFVLKHEYKKEKFSITTKFDARYGISVIDTVTFKNEDKFNLNILLAWQMSKSWAYSGAVNFRSQFTKGYKSKDNKTLVSNFMAPGVVDISLGFTYNPEKSPWKITLAPITGSVLFVLDDELSAKKLNGIDPGKHIKPMVGPSVNIDFDKTFAKGALRYQSNFYSFYNFRLDPTARWENTFSLRATKWLSTSIYWLMIYDREIETPKGNNKLQINYSVGVGLSFIYKNKK